MDTLDLSRLQFAVNISFHILFPTITMALCWILFYFKLRHSISQNPVWMRAYRFWVKVFALTFALGVVSGITMSFQFGTNWPGFMETVGNIAGPLLGYEVLTAFFLEATFLGVMLFGSTRVPDAIHTLATFIVAIGTSLSAFWILALNSWMQTPSGYELRDDVAYATDWFDIIFNPSFPYRLVHMLIASGLCSAFFVAGLSAYRIQKGDQKHAPKLALKTGIILAAILAPIQIFVGDLHGLNTLEHQPQKVAAMEGLWETRQGAPLLLFALPNQTTQENDLEIGIPHLASLILTHEINGEVRGLNEFQDALPNVARVFWSFRIMVTAGLFMLALSWFAAWQIIRAKTFPPWLLKVISRCTFIGWVATLAGWYVSETGRQPWLVTGILKTADAVTATPASSVGISLLLYCALYAVLLSAYIHTLNVMARKAVDIDEYETGPSSPFNTVRDTHLGKMPSTGAQSPNATGGCI